MIANIKYPSQLVMSPRHKHVRDRFRILKEDTQTIGFILGMKESEVYNLLAEARMMSRTPRALHSDRFA